MRGGGVLSKVLQIKTLVVQVRGGQKGWKLGQRKEYWVDKDNRAVDLCVTETL